MVTAVAQVRFPGLGKKKRKRKGKKRKKKKKDRPSSVINRGPFCRTYREKDGSVGS